MILTCDMLLFLTKKYASEYLNQNDDNMSCVTTTTGITGTSVFLPKIE